MTFTEVLIRILIDKNTKIHRVNWLAHQFIHLNADSTEFIDENGVGIMSLINYKHVNLYEEENAWEIYKQDTENSDKQIKDYKNIETQADIEKLKNDLLSVKKYLLNNGEHIRELRRIVENNAKKIDNLQRELNCHLQFNHLVKLNEV